MVDKRVDLKREVGEREHVVDKPVAVVLGQIVGRRKKMQVLADGRSSYSPK